ncbi:MAG: ketopantoate reductase [Piscirickettsiaceae bacterium]|nr:MAG: ketopantoate reductase [Piscirickettsiaceae bacterium]
MNSKLHICIHGAGGLGSVIGGYLAKSGHMVTLISRSAHAEAVNKQGLNIFGRLGDMVIKDNLTAVTTPDKVVGDIDYYILLTKAKDAASAISDAVVISNQIKCALTMQNGVGKESLLVDAFGKERVIGGSIIEGATLIKPGRVNNHVTAPTTAYFGELGGGSTQRTDVLAQAFTNANLNAKSVEDIDNVLWEKVVQVSGASSWSASTLGAIPALDYWDGISIREGAEHYVTIAQELINVYKAMGYTPKDYYAPFSFLKMIDESSFETSVQACIDMGVTMKPKTPGVRTSMHEDLVNGKETEADTLFMPLVEQAKKYNIAIPTFLGAYRVIKTIDANLNKRN